MDVQSIPENFNKCTDIEDCTIQCFVASGCIKYSRGFLQVYKQIYHGLISAKILYAAVYEVHE